MHKYTITERVALFVIALVGLIVAHHTCAAVHNRLNKPLLYPGEVVCQPVTGGRICFTPFCPSPLPSTSPQAVVRARVFDDSTMIARGNCGLEGFAFYPDAPQTKLVGWIELLTNGIAAILNYLLFGLY